jgi:DNA-binding SARP family transcriptional activator
VAAAAAERRLRALGVRAGAAAGAGLLRAVAAPAGAGVRVQALGGFRVQRGGVPVRLEEWQSKKARDLLKVLVSRRGRATPRELLAELLWPGEPPDRVANRLSVALSVARTVLDPERALPPDRYLVADKATVRLGDIPVDVEEFLATAAAGLAAGADPASAAELLAAAEAGYSGDFLEDDPYEDWAAPLREEARAAYLAVARALAARAGAAGEHDLAVRYHLRVLERDPYDEAAHLGLVLTLSAAGRHGEARRRYRFYVERMGEIGVETEPFPAAPRPAPRPTGTRPAAPLPTASLPAVPQPPPATSAPEAAAGTAAPGSPASGAAPNGARRPGHSRP